MNLLSVKNQVRPLSVLALLMLLFSFFSCKEDPKDEEIPSSLPWGAWTHTFNGANQYTAELHLQQADGKYAWVIMDTLTGIENDLGSVLEGGNQLGFYNNGNCWETGVYEYTAQNGMLKLSMLSDSCPGRMEKLKTDWKTKDISGMQALAASWQRNMNVGGTDYRVRLTMSVSGLLTWEMIDPIPGHSNSSVSFTATDSTIVIYKDTDCNGNGYYKWNISNNELTISLLKDHCPPRAPSFSGIWLRP